MRITTRIISNLLIAVFFIALPAQAARSYLIELVVFSMPDRGTDEKWTTAHPPLNQRKMSKAKLPARIMDGIKNEPVEKVQSNFSSSVNRIRKNPARNIILSTRWVQTVLNPANTVIARITNRKNITNDVQAGITDTKPGFNDSQRPLPHPILDGFINFYLAGTYTLEADIRYTPAYRPSILDEEPSAGPVSYRIHEKRRMKSGELNYYDHPKLGMVLMVTPVEIPVEQ
ncbi:MAG: CsiV family protein [Arenicellales bacterium]